MLVSSSAFRTPVCISREVEDLFDFIGFGDKAFNEFAQIEPFVIAKIPGTSDGNGRG